MAQMRTCLFTTLAIYSLPIPSRFPPSHAVGLWLRGGGSLVSQAICSLRSPWWLRRWVPLVGPREDPGRGKSCARLFIVGRPYRVQQEQARLVSRLCGLPQCCLHMRVIPRIVIACGLLCVWHPGL